MSDTLNSSPGSPVAATPKIKEKRSFSIVWLVPLVALVIGGLLAYKAVTEKGPVITISFATAEGLEAGKTKVKYKDVEVGVVESITIGKDLAQVILRVEMKKGAEPYLTDRTKFWVVRARVGADQVSGLSTLLGGAYIGIEPSAEGAQTTTYKGLEKPPVVTRGMKGKHFHLSSKSRGSLEAGVPIYFRQIKVGRVVDYTLNEKGDNIGIHIFIDSPYDKFVRENTKFWLASGLDVQLTADGLEVDTESIVSMLIGGIAFNTLSDEDIGAEAAEKSLFTLYKNRDAAIDDRYTIREQYYVEFNESVRGLSVGAPVEFRGMKVGSVDGIELKADYEKLEFSTMVLVTFERERLGLSAMEKEQLDQRLAQQTNKGFRAQLKTGNLLTGQLFVDLEYFPEAPAAEITVYNDLPVMPSMASSSEKLMHDVSKFAARLGQFPIEDIGRDLQQAIGGLSRLLNSPELQELPGELKQVMVNIEQTTQSIDSSTLPQINEAIAEMEKLLSDIGKWFGADSQLYDDLGGALREIAEAAQSIRNVADLLERHPEALIQGKNEDRL